MGATYGLGFVCFFDGLANSLLVGKTMLEPATRLGVSREKLAYIVDSTSSAVACVAIMSTWIAYQLSMIREGIHAAGL
jgi:tetracycline resistance efflux pump